MKNLKKLVVCLMAVVLAITVAPVFTEAKSANRIEFKKSTVNLYVGEKYSNGIKAVYKDGTNWGAVRASSFKYTVSKKGIVSISKQGTITAKKKGTVKVTASSVYDRRIKGSFTVKVTKGIQNAKLTVASKELVTCPDGKVAISVKSLKGVSNKELVYRVANESIASVSSNGKVEAKRLGTTSITVQSVVNKKAKATVKLVVKDHNWVTKTEEPATCTEEGYSCAYCSFCGDCLQDETPALGHDYVKEYKEASKGVTGGDYSICSRCGDTVIENAVYYQPTMEELEASLAAVKAVYPTGMEWYLTDGYGNDTHYAMIGEDGKAHMSGRGCSGFACMVSNAIFGENVPAKEIKNADPSQVHIGDVVSFYGDNIDHVVIVIGFTSDGGWITAEGNVAGRVKWGVGNKLVGTDLYRSHGKYVGYQDGVGAVYEEYSANDVLDFRGTPSSHNTKISVYTRWK